jgi:hypothetical protein
MQKFPYLKSFAVFLIMTTAPFIPIAAAQKDATISEGEALVRAVFSPPTTEEELRHVEERGVTGARLEQPRAARQAVLLRIEKRGKLDVVAGLIQFLRTSYDTEGTLQTLSALTGDNPGPAWEDWMLWQEAHPQVTPFAGFDGFLADQMARIDPKFRLFLRRGVEHDIRLEEIAWGGVVKDGIPALTNPKLINPKDAEYRIEPAELVFGVSINGDTRAYPLRFLDWHEMFNDVIGGKAVSLAYCTLCGSGILFETTVKGRNKPFVFGSSGFLYRSNKLMYDTESNSLWNQFTGRPVVGPLTGSGIELKILPVVITRWEKWFAAHPDSTILSDDTGYYRDYRPGRPYGEYFASGDLMFPALVRDKRLKPKDYVFAVRSLDKNGMPVEKAWALSAFEGFKVINDSVGDKKVVLIGDASSRTVRAYEAGALNFAADEKSRGQVHAGGVMWNVTEEALRAADGRTASRLPGHIAYWFAWQGYKPKAEFSAAKAIR